METPLDQTLDAGAACDGKRLLQRAKVKLRASPDPQLKKDTSWYMSSCLIARFPNTPVKRYNLIPFFDAVNVKQQDATAKEMSTLPGCLV